MTTAIRRLTAWFAALTAVLALSGCGYNQFQTLDEQVKAAWSEVIEARAKATSIQVTPETLNNPEAFAKFQQVQGEIGSALSRLMAVSESYPTLKANQAFQDLRVQLEGTENRITVARNRYIKSVADYNVLARQFPTNLTAMIFSYAVKPSFTVANEAQISTPPAVSFDKAPAAAPAASK
jgi:LemA protein